jgi:O-antigen/teichoic acid export membrane protein
MSLEAGQAAPVVPLAESIEPPPVAASRRNRLRPRDHLASTTWALMANTGVTSVLGIAFWAGASALYKPADLGVSAALISAMMLLSVISQLDLAMGISRLLPQVHSRRWRPVLGAYSAAAVAGLVVTGVFVVVAPRVSGSFAFLSGYRWLPIALIVAVILWNIFALQDAVLTSARRTAVVPVENGLFGALKIGLLVVLAHSVHGQGIFIAWVVAMAVTLVPVNSLIFGRVLPAQDRADDEVSTALPLGDRRRVVRYLAVDYVAGLLNQGYTAVLPLLVLAVLGREANAYFYIAFMIAGAARAVAQSMSTSLVVEGAHSESQLGALARLSVVRYVKYALPGIVVVALGANLLLRPFGAAYVDHGATLLRLFLLATVPHAVITLYLGLERVRGRVTRVLAVEAALVVLVIGGAVVGMHTHGLVGVGVAWVGAHTVVAALVAPGFWRACRP